MVPSLPADNDDLGLNITVLCKWHTVPAPSVSFSGLRDKTMYERPISWSRAQWYAAQLHFNKMLPTFDVATEAGAKALALLVAWVNHWKPKPQHGRGKPSLFRSMKFQSRSRYMPHQGQQEIARRLARG